ncbi:hypothetical protein SBRY_60187 [Actinacidiphila bryophytorum]|uniref:Uncharacterized protein n=1 Tax=Actinacidiphila bryophytorum TaxID=1436133 RepID=A0A9W4MJ72_9ACTN|nr:hypothetical protein SBRY_60187 [Actinacidiphila bryophytorum]
MRSWLELLVDQMAYVLPTLGPAKKHALFPVAWQRADVPFAPMAAVRTIGLTTLGFADEGAAAWAGALIATGAMTAAAPTRTLATRRFSMGFSVRTDPMRIKVISLLHRMQ